MSVDQKKPSEVLPWQLELDKIGFVRKIFLARKWYKGDWWFVLISAILLLFFLIRDAHDAFL